MGPNRQRQLREFERDAEKLVVYQLDLLALVERELRAVHHTMRHIEKLRSARARVGPELSNGQRGDTLKSLSDEIADLDVHFQSEHECCTEMQTTIAQMQNLLKQLRTRTSHPSIGASAHSPKDAES